MMYVQHMTGALAGGVVLGAVAASALGQVFVHAEGEALIRFLEVREITNGTRIGPTGLNLHYWLTGGGVGGFRPATNLGSYASFGPGQPIASPGTHAPLPNTGFSHRHEFEALAEPFGFGTVGTIGSATINYTNVTGGRSAYEIDGEVSFDIALESDLTDPARESVAVWGQVRVVILDEMGFSLIESELLTISGANASASVSSRVYPFTMTIGNIGGGYRKDLAEIHVMINLLASIHAVPAPGGIALLSAAGLCAAGRRRD